MYLHIGQTKEALMRQITPRGTVSTNRQPSPSTADASGAALPAVVQVRLTGPPAAVAAASAAQAEKFGPLWQPGSTRPSRHAGGDVLMYATLIVPV